MDEKPANDICWRDNIFFTDPKASACCFVGLPPKEFHRADLSTDLVRAALYKTRGYTWSGVEALAADPEAINAIVAQVMEKE